MSDLATWLLARIAEDEAAARASYDEASDYRVVGSELAELHFVNWKPDRVLAECAAKRRIVEELVPLLGFQAREDYDNSENVWAEIASERAERLIRLLAQPYADRPGWDEAWEVGT